MLPSVLAKQLQQGLGDYLATTYPMANEPFRGSLAKMIATKDALFHEPYLAVRLPFKVAEKMPTCFTAIHPEYLPYRHQQLAFERLCGEDLRSTLVATGTGSGKTECFLYPILEYCYRQRGKKGIKALIIYPMNALASDQAKRLASLIYHSPELKGNVTAGMYVGGIEHEASTAMSATGLITDRQTILNAPPDILLTNYKMLDYLLVRPHDADLWKQNNGDTLKFIAVDELHTFDGAQGTDLACLLRRLKARLDIRPGYLCCVGTSATLGSGDSGETIRRYAEGIFGELFAKDSLIVEDRLSAQEFLAGTEPDDFKLPEPAQLTELECCQNEDDEIGYIRTAIAAWLDNYHGDPQTPAGRLELGHCLKRHDFTQYLLRTLDGHYLQASEIVAKLNNSVRGISEWGDGQTAINALFALLSHARSGSADNLRPFVQVQVQLWLRELRRVLSKVDSQNVAFALAGELNAKQAQHYLPVVNCRECGLTGWVTLLDERQSANLTNLSKFYQAFFSRDNSVTLMFPYAGERIPSGTEPARLCPECLQLSPDSSNSKVCSRCGVPTVAVFLPKYAGRERGLKQFPCPCCGNRSGLSLLGLRSATEISTVISQLFASKFNDDKKTLTFSDSVQDASHRAGFFNFRTWRFGLRRAIQRYVQAGGAGQTLADFIPGLLAYWHQAMKDEVFVSFFIAPNLVWMQAYEDLLTRGELRRSQSATLIEYIEKRLSYEVLQEYGIMSHIGRTLQKSACSCLTFPPDTLSKVAAAVRERLANELGELHDLGDKACRQIVAGYLDRLRLDGAIADDVFVAYVREGGKEYLLSNSRLHWSPGVRGGRNAPRFMRHPASGLHSSSDNFNTPGSKQYRNWIETCIYRNVDSLLSAGTLTEISAIIVEELAKAELLQPLKIAFGGQAYGLNPQTCRVSADLGRWRCDKCGAKYNWAQDLADIWDGAPCLRPGCEGCLVRLTDAAVDYYGHLYCGGDLVRTNACEHTGLLERDQREKLEKDFKRAPGQHRAWDPNVLSCTPTLEMGIDIGDLSTVIMCSMPPAQAQFVQRSGRAGRRDGNSLTLAVAASRPHDMYFYADPKDMIEGEVAAPHIFLEASAVLERQFIAFCMDNWVKSGVSAQAIPKNVGICLSHLQRNNAGDFPHNFLKFVKSNLSQRLAAFCEMFGDLTDSAKEELAAFAQGDGNGETPLDVKVLAAFAELRIQCDGLKKHIRDLRDKIKELEAKPKDWSFDEDIKDLRVEIKALGHVMHDLTSKDVFNFLSDEGLLPNYAFPEEGITLKAVLWRYEVPAEGESENQRRPGSNRSIKIKGEWRRGASAAISELAPNNSFYVDGKKLTIDQIDMNAAEAARWRLCPSCSHIQREEAGQSSASCPRCGSRGWADAGQVHTLLKVPVVYSNMDYRKSISGDESEERSFVYYNKMLLVDVDEEREVVCAYQLDNDEFSFGYDYVKKTTLREINFGTDDTVGEKLRVAGHDDVRKGFRICKYCGKVQPESGDPVHTKYCKAKDNAELEDEATGSYMFLFREFQTEVLRVLIPATTLDSSQCNTQSFVAAFMLGLNEHFGNVSHLGVTISDVPVEGLEYRKQYLVVYDTVPGGTGYLKQLMQREGDLIEVLRKSLHVMENCRCKDDPEKDGCYHCLFAYSEGRRIGGISRTAAIRLIRTILSGKKPLQKIARLSDVPTNTLCESELEQKFLAMLPALSRQGRQVKVAPFALTNNASGYMLTLDNGAGRTVKWEIELQCHLGPSDGVAVDCRPDFVFRPVSERRRAVAVFTDGFEFHRNIAGADTLKREALRRSGKYWVWSFSWQDVLAVSTAQGSYATPTLDWAIMPAGKIMYQRVVESGKATAVQPSRQAPMELFLSFLLEERAEEIFAAQARSYALSLLDWTKMNDNLAQAAWKERVSQLEEATGGSGDGWKETALCFGRWYPRENVPALVIMAGIDSVRMCNDSEACPAVFAVLDDREENRTDIYQADWNGFWHFCNVMQHGAAFLAVSEEGLKQGLYYKLAPTVAEPLPEVEPEVDSGEPGAATGDDTLWQEVLDNLVDGHALAMAKRLQRLGVPVPEVGVDLEDEQGEMVTMAEMAWCDLRICYLIGEHVQDKGKMLALGWRVIEDGDALEPSLFGGSNHE